MCTRYNEENYKTLMTEIKGDPNKWRECPCSWTGKRY